MATLSFTSLSTLHEHPHCWLNKQAGIKMPEWDFFTKGKEGHRIVQDHVSGRVPDPRLKGFDYKFPLVEEVDFDKRMNFRLKINDKFDIQGFFDGLNDEELRSLEVKTGTPWTLGQFQRSYQRKLYSLLRPDIQEQLLISLNCNPDKWLTEKPRIFTICPTQRDRDEAMAWILGGIKVLESGDFYSDLVKSDDGEYHCADPRCLYGNNCLFK